MTLSTQSSMPSIITSREGQPESQIVHEFIERDFNTGKLSGRYQRHVGGFIESIRYFYMDIPCDTWTFYWPGSDRINHTLTFPSIDSSLHVLGRPYQRIWRANDEHNSFIAIEQFNPTSGALQRVFEFWPNHGGGGPRVSRSLYINRFGRLINCTEYDEGGKIVTLISCKYRKGTNPFRCWHKNAAPELAIGFNVPGADEYTQLSEVRGGPSGQGYLLHFQDLHLHGMQFFNSGIEMEYYHGWIKAKLLWVVRMLELRYRIKRLLAIMSCSFFKEWWDACKPIAIHFGSITEVSNPPRIVYSKPKIIRPTVVLAQQEPTKKKQETLLYSDVVCKAAGLKKYRPVVRPLVS